MTGLILIKVIIDNNFYRNNITTSNSLLIDVIIA